MDQWIYTTPGIGRRGAGGRGHGAFKKFPWFKTALALQAGLPFVPFPVLMKKAKKMWERKHPPEGSQDPAAPVTDPNAPAPMAQPVSGIFTGVDLKSIGIGLVLGLGLSHISKKKRGR